MAREAVLALDAVRYASESSEIDFETAAQCFRPIDIAYARLSSWRTNIPHHDSLRSLSRELQTRVLAWCDAQVLARIECTCRTFVQPRQRPSIVDEIVVSRVSRTSWAPLGKRSSPSLLKFHEQLAKPRKLEEVVALLNAEHVRLICSEWCVGFQESEAR